jgi:hypothetical protein
MKLIVADDVTEQLVSIVSQKTKWGFSELVTLIRKTVGDMPDMYSVFSPNAAPIHAIAGENVPEASAVDARGVSFTPAGTPILESVSKEIQTDQAAPPTDPDQLTQAPPQLPKNDGRPSMHLDPEDFEAKADIIRLNEHTKESRRGKA